MMSRLLALLVLVVISTAVEAQRIDTVWSRTYSSQGGTGLNALAVDREGNICVLGTSSWDSENGYVTAKYFPNGDTAWVRVYNWPENAYDYATAIACDITGNVYVTGTANGGFDPHHYGFGTIKYSPNGDTLWTRFYHDPNSVFDGWSTGLVVDPAGNACVTGYMAAAQNMDYTTVKYYANGDTAWVRRYDGPSHGFDRANAIATDSYGNIYVTGSSNGVSSSLDITTIKYLVDGRTAWVHRYNGSANTGDYGDAIAVDRQGNVYVTGLTMVSGGHGAMVTIKYSPDGFEQWVAIYGGTSGVYGRGGAIVADANGNVYVGGVGAVVAKYLPNGTAAWVAKYGSGQGMVSAIALDSSGGCVIVGGLADSAHLESGYIFTTVKFDQYGHQRWAAQRFSLAAPNFQVGYANAVGLDAIGDIFVAGQTNDSLQAATVRYRENWCGDVDHSYFVDISDAVFVVRYVFGGGPAPDPLLLGDVNGDGQVDMNDVVYLITYIFSGGPSPCARS
jgi:hypothetical protein